MSFASTLQRYMDTLDCSAKELSEAAGLSPSGLSRYLSGNRVPQQGSEALSKLAAGLAMLAQQRGASDMDEDTILADLSQEVTGIETDYATFSTNLRLLIERMDISSNSLARSLSFDPSYISRILNGHRRPGNLPRFVTGVSQYVARNYSDDAHAAVLAMTIGCSAEEAADPEQCIRAVMRFLASETQTASNPIDGFLAKLDEFDLNEYIASIRFDELKVPTAPFQLPTTRTYTGIAEMRQGELDFLKAAVLSKSQEDVILYSDMPMTEMAADPEFPKKVMMGFALLLKKGLHLQNIHDVYRPIDEMAMGLEGWIPLYMTGQVSSYYLKEPTNRSFLHFLRSAGTVALSGEAIAGHQAQGRYVMTKAKDDVAYYRTRAELLLKSARPLLRSFDTNRQTKLDSIIEAIHEKDGDATVAVGEGVFKNMTITVLPKRYALIRKTNPPAMAFLIEHPLLVDAIERYEPQLEY